MQYLRCKFSEIRDEIMPIWQRHYEEIALNKEVIPLDPNWEQYDKMDQAGLLHVLVAKEFGKICGYYFFYMSPHLHYKSTLTAFTDIYIILPEYRKGFTGVRLIKETMKWAKELGAVQMYAGTKIHMGPKILKLFELLGFKQVETVCTKVL